MRDAVCAELLPQANRHRVLQMRAAALQHIVELGTLGEERITELAKGLGEVAREREGAEADGRGDHVVGGLRHVDVIVRMDRCVASARGSQALVSEIREHLVHVHVVRRAGARLEDIDDEVLAMRSRQNLVGRPNNGVCERGIQPAGLLVRERRGLLDPDDSGDEHRQGAHAADRKVLRSANGLGAVERADRNG